MCFLFCSLLSLAQAPGYLGKQFIVGYENYFSFAFIGPTSTNSRNSNGDVSADELANLKFLGFNTTHCLNIDYVIKKRTNFCFSLQHFKTGIDYENYYDYGGNVRYFGDVGKPAILSSWNGGLGFKFFNKGYIAPVGKYLKLELLLMFYNIKYNYTQFENNNHQKVAVGTGQYNYSNFAITATGGRQMILADKIIIDYGFRLGITPIVVPTFIINEYDSGGTVEDTFRTQGRYRVFREQFVNFRIGIGFLAF